MQNIRKLCKKLSCETILVRATRSIYPGNSKVQFLFFVGTHESCGQISYHNSADRILYQLLDLHGLIRAYYNCKESRVEIGGHMDNNIWISLQNIILICLNREVGTCKKQIKNLWSSYHFCQSNQERKHNGRTQIFSQNMHEALSWQREPSLLDSCPMDTIALVSKQYHIVM